MSNACYLVGIGGGTGSGKTTFAGEVLRLANSPRVGLMIMDWYYRDAPGTHPLEYNFDAPEAFDLPLLSQHLRALRDGEAVQRPVYDYKTHCRAAEPEAFGPFDVLLIEGILVLSVSEVTEWLDYRVFVDYPDDLRLIRRIERDMAERGRSVESVLGQWQKTVRPMHQKYIESARSQAHRIVPGTDNDDHATRLASHLEEQMSFAKRR